jgi:molybdopterin converting factor subunit 1
MEVEVRLFAMLRERAGTGALRLQLPDGATVGDAIAAAGRHGGLAELIESIPVAVAVNREYVRDNRRLSEGDEVALIPPVSGGSPERGDG